MGRIAKVLSALTTEKSGFEIREMKVELKALYNIIGAMFAAPGDDSTPLKDDRVLLISREESGQYAICGVLNKNPITQPGEKRLYSRDTNGNEKATIHFKGDGALEFNGNSDNLVTFADLKTAYDDLVSFVNNFITTKYNLHNHPSAPPGLVSPPSITGTSTSLSVDAAKADTLKTDG